MQDNIKTQLDVLDDIDQKFGEWALVELMGHNQLAGYVSEFSIGGASFVRIDVPKIGSTIPEPFTKFFNPSAIYCITPCTEKAAKVVLMEIQPRPIRIFNPDGWS